MAARLVNPKNKAEEIFKEIKTLRFGQYVKKVLFKNVLSCDRIQGFSSVSSFKI